MHRTKWTVLVPLSCCLLLAAFAAPAAAAGQHAVTVEWVFTGTNCPLSTVVISASSCDPSAIAAELTSEMTSAGFAYGGCSFYLGPEDWECIAPLPTDCTLVDTTMSIKPGSDCASPRIRGENYGLYGSYLIFFYDDVFP